MQIELTDIQMYFLALGLMALIIVWFWAVVVAIPNRNSTIEFQRERIQTLEYWVEHMATDGGQMIPLTGTALQRKHNQLVNVQMSLKKQLERVGADLAFFNSLLEKKPLNEKQ